jgi:hypothetical protein
MTTPITKRPVFLRGVLEAAAEVSLSIGTDGKFYRNTVQSMLDKLEGGYKDKLDTYHPLVAVAVWQGATVYARQAYREVTLSGIHLDLDENVALARMLERKYREELFARLGVPAEQVPAFECDADLSRSDAEF